MGALEPGHPRSRRQGRSPSNSTDCRAPAARSRDRITVLGLGADGRLVVGRAEERPDPRHRGPAIKYAAMASRILPETLADHYARFQSRRQMPVTPDEALADLQAHAPDLSQESLRRPRIVLLARDFSPVVTASVVWLSEMGLDISLVQISAFRSYVYGQLGSGNVPMISVSQLYPLREVEEFTISPERQLAKEMAESKRRVQDASTVRRLVTAETVADGTIFTLSPRSDLSFDMRSQLEEWLHADPARRTAHWQNNLNAPLVWDVDKAVVHAGGPRAPHRRAGHRGDARLRSAPSGGATPRDGRMVELAGPLERWQGRPLPRATGRAGSRRSASNTAHWTQMSTLPAQNFITLPSPIKGTHYGLAFAAGGRLRSDFYVDLGSAEASAAQFEVLQSQRQLIESVYGGPLSWERLPDRGAYRIADYSEGEVTTVEDYAFYIDWMIDAQERLRQAVNAVLRSGEPAGRDRSTAAESRHDASASRRASGANTATSPAVHSSDGTR